MSSPQFNFTAGGSNMARMGGHAVKANVNLEQPKMGRALRIWTIALGVAFVLLMLLPTILR